MAAAQAAEARQRAEAERQAKAAGRSVTDSSTSDDAAGSSKPEGGLSEEALFAGSESKSGKANNGEPEEEQDATGVDAEDIETVMKQAPCSRNKAIAVLKEHNGDIVNAIMAATP